jgi:hypothetical protein
LSKEPSFGITKKEKTVLVNYKIDFSSTQNLMNTIKEKIFPKEMKQSCVFVETYKEALIDMIYLSYKMGLRDNLVSFDGKENYHLAEWVLNNRNYVFIQGIYNDPEILSYRMWQIISEKSKKDLYD